MKKRKIYSVWLGGRQLITGSNLDVVVKRLEQRAEDEATNISRYEIRIYYV